MCGVKRNRESRSTEALASFTVLGEDGEYEMEQGRGQDQLTTTSGVA